MKLSELVIHQKEWESRRGIDNGNHNLERIQVELDEAKNETDPMQRIWELIDIIIITSGGLYKLCDEVGMEYDALDERLKEKLQINDIKYNEKYFETWDSEEAQAYARFIWSFNQAEFGTPNDVY